MEGGDVRGGRGSGGGRVRSNERGIREEKESTGGGGPFSNMCGRLSLTVVPRQQQPQLRGRRARARSRRFRQARRGPCSISSPPSSHRPALARFPPERNHLPHWRHRPRIRDHLRCSPLSCSIFLSDSFFLILLCSDCDDAAASSAGPEDGTKVTIRSCCSPSSSGPSLFSVLSPGSRPSSNEESPPRRRRRRSAVLWFPPSLPSLL